ncbi:hypothetical protein P154DRAFT_144164 [Amniculicola lignicola CBS 123094]|uniref:Uncharacterized protein n=1 Tax=Amniculicola lignicola CBS 123094 TaxID=1392246 RepID=A0A6A5WX82_9PLEO|nr:hypothetical protein P154DRAFT_144164 [Amniculicola lignicola CBS 123094]
MALYCGVQQAIVSRAAQPRLLACSQSHTLETTLLFFCQVRSFPSDTTRRRQENFPKAMMHRGGYLGSYSARRCSSYLHAMHPSTSIKVQTSDVARPSPSPLNNLSRPPISQSASPTPNAPPIPQAEQRSPTPRSWTTAPQHPTPIPAPDPVAF